MTYAAGADVVAGAVLAHHPLVIALPFVASAVIVVGLVVGVVVRDRRQDRQEPPR